MKYFFDFELADLRGIPLYVPVQATAADGDDAIFVRDRVRDALVGRGYVVKQAAGPYPLASEDAASFAAERRAAYQREEFPKKELACSVFAPPKSARSIRCPLRATILDAQKKVEELLPITVEL